VPLFSNFWIRKKKSINNFANSSVIEIDTTCSRWTTWTKKSFQVQINHCPLNCLKENKIILRQSNAPSTMFQENVSEMYRLGVYSGIVRIEFLIPFKLNFRWNRSLRNDVLYRQQFNELRLEQSESARSKESQCGNN